ncbi:MAG: UDP-GlcNAc:undecaprenyl-phosphate GlcNAc-1-phosphate transferase [Cognaticolwellia sp.]
MLKNSKITNMDENLIRLGLVFLTGFFVTYFAIPSILEIAYKKNLFDIPDERKVHKRAIPSLGGVGIFVGVLIAFTVWATPEVLGMKSYRFILTSYFILFFMGLKDDLIIMKALPKLIIQIGVACLLVYSGIRITNLFGIFGIYVLNYYVSFVLSVFFIVGVTNAFNLIDGIDGLAGGLGGINCLTFGALMYIYEQYEFAILALAIGGSLLAFLRYNFSSYPTKIFMGDTGSLLLGLTVSILSIVFMNTSAQSGSLGVISPPIVVLGIIFIPIMDTFRVIIIRILSGRSPFSPDRNHIHHQFLESGVTHKMASIALYMINIALVVTVIVFHRSESTLLGVLILFVGSASTQILVFLRYKKRDRRVDDLNKKLDLLKKENQFLR